MLWIWKRHDRLRRYQDRSTNGCTSWSGVVMRFTLKFRLLSIKFTSERFVLEPNSPHPRAFRTPAARPLVRLPFAARVY
jgi:hypothetical protein